MQSKLTIYWEDGRITEYPDQAFRFTGGHDCPTAEVDYRFDDLTDGLYVEVRFQEAVGNAEGQPPDMRGNACERRNDCFYQVFPAQGCEHVLAVFHDGVKRLARIGGELVSLARIDALSGIYLSTDDCNSDIDAIAALYGHLCRDYADRSEDEVHANVAADLGLSVDVLKRCLDAHAAACCEDDEVQEDADELDFGDIDTDEDYE